MDDVGWWCMLVGVPLYLTFNYIQHEITSMKVQINDLERRLSDFEPDTDFKIFSRLLVCVFIKTSAAGR